MDQHHHTETWRARQERVLTHYRKRSGKDVNVIARDAGLSYWRYVRIENGLTGLPAEFVPHLAAAYGVPAGQLAEALELIEPIADTSPSLRRLLEAGDVPEDEIREVLTEVSEQTLTADAMRQIAQIIIEDVTRYPRRAPPHQRASNC